MTKKNAIAQALCGALATLMVGTDVYACTRAVYLGPENTIITVRSMDWLNDMQTNLWAFPRGMKRDGTAGSNSIQWTSKYGSVVASVFDGGTADGMNEKGLVANMLYLSESEYVKPTANDRRKPISLAAWTQYVLDNYATVAEAEAIAAAFSVIRNTSVPIGITTPGQPNISSTLWRTVSDHKNKRYYFESTRKPNVFWVNLADMDFTEGKPTKKLTLTSGTFFAGNTAAQFQTAEPFKFLPATVK